MHGHGRRWQAFWKGDRPRQRARQSVVVPHEEAADPPDRVPDGQGRRGRRQHRHDRQPATTQQHEAGDQAAGQTAEPAQAAAREQQGEECLITSVFDRPHQLRARQPANDAGHPGVDGAVGQPTAAQLALKQPDAHQGRDRHQHTEAGDLELSDAEQDRVDGALLSPYCAAGRRARLDVCECRICHAPSDPLIRT